MTSERTWLKKAAFLLAAAFLVLSCIRGVWAVDFWWQLATGRLIAESGIPHEDVFSYPSLGNAWYEMRWLYCLTIYELYTHLGLWSVVVLKTLVVCAAFTIAFFTEYRREQWAFCLVVGVMAVYASSIRFFDRPELWSYLFLALYIWLIQRWRVQGGKLLWLLPLLQVVWTNSHTLFLIGPGIAMFAFLSVVRHPEKRVTAFVVFLLTAVACLANPYGLQGAIFPLQLLSQVHGTVFKDNIQELKGPFDAGVTGTEMGFYAALIALAAVGFLVRRGRVDLFLLLSTGAMLYLSLTGIRNVPLFCIAALPFIFVCFSDVGSLRVPAMHSLLAWASMASCLFMLWTIATRRWIVWRNDVGAVSFGLAPHRYPIEAVAFMKAQGLQGPVYNTMSEGSYLIWNGYKSFIDPRLEVAGGEHFAESQRIIFDKSAFASAEAKYGFQTALVDLTSPVNETLLASKAWTLVFFDTVAAVYAKGPAFEMLAAVRAAEVADSLKETRSISDRASWFLPAGLSSPQARLSHFLLMAEERLWAKVFAKDALRIFPGTRLANAVLGQIYFDKGDDAQALPYLIRAARESPQNETILRALGVCYRRTGDVENAVTYLRRAVNVSATADNWISLADALAIGGDADGAADAYREGLALDPKRPSTWLKLAALLQLQNKNAESTAAIREGLQANPGDTELTRRLKN